MEVGRRGIHGLLVVKRGWMLGLMRLRALIQSAKTDMLGFFAN